MGYAKGSVIELIRPTSFSKLHDFNECPRRYYWAHVLKTERDEKALELKYGYGSWFHTRAELGLRALFAEMETQRRGNPFLPALPNLAVFTHAAFADGVPSDKQKKWDAMMPHFVDWLKTNRTWFSLIGSNSQILIEEPFALSRDWKPMAWDGVTRERPDNLGLRGKLDLTFLCRPLVTSLNGASLRTPGRAYFFDWKSSTIRSRSIDPKTNQPAPQLGLYAFALFCQYEWLEEVIAAFFNVRWKSSEPPVTFTRQQAMELGPGWVDMVVADLMERDPYNVECWEPKLNQWCQLCEFKDQCPLAKANRYNRAKAIAAEALVEAGD